MMISMIMICSNIQPCYFKLDFNYFKIFFLSRNQSLGYGWSLVILMQLSFLIELY